MLIERGGRGWTLGNGFSPAQHTSYTYLPTTNLTHPSMRYRLTSLHRFIRILVDHSPPQWHPGRFLLSLEPHSFTLVFNCLVLGFFKCRTSEEGGEGIIHRSIRGKDLQGRYHERTALTGRTGSPAENVLLLLFSLREPPRLGFMCPSWACQGSCRFCFLIHLASHRFCGHRPRTRRRGRYAHNTSSCLMPMVVDVMYHDISVSGFSREGFSL